MQSASFQINDAAANLLARYVAQLDASVPRNDEMVTSDGQLKPVWTPFFEHLSTLTPDALARRFARGDQYLRDAGVLYRQYDESMSTEREWPLSHIPVILDDAEWQTISAGLIERANLLEDILSDFYGANTLVSSGQLPATLLSQNPAWLRPMVGTLHSTAPLLNTLSFELGRGPDGKWWVISDVVEAPSTTGFAIENRIAMGRVFPNFFNDANIHRLAGFFQQFQQTLIAMKGRSAGEIALLSPGPMNQNYAEHAYMARYLGLLLVEGEDLIVQDGKAMVRTVAGNKPISLLWNRLPSTMFDPLELDASSMLGAAGLVQALRDGALKTVNMVGAGVLETRALMAFLPKIARARLGHALSLPNIATWWCGQDSQRDEVMANRDRMMVGNAFSTTPLMADPTTLSLGHDPNSPRAAAFKEMLQNDGQNLVGQEAVTLSTAPAFEDGALVARPMCIRISLGRTNEGWAVMPGGYARISASLDAKALAMQQGGKVADVWVASKTKVETPSLLTQNSPAHSHTATQSILPSRAADNLFWVGRYVERAEQNMRFFRAYFARISEGMKHSDAVPKFMRAALMDKVAPDASDMAKRVGKP
ncbi:MAG: circularly permuted type 2 ATP-grasp protein, partial [Paracoccaceae bacterium]